MVNSTHVRRTPRACEHCRQTRRRCEPPYPCRQCVAAGISCDVRAKARPQRRQQHRRIASTSRNGESTFEGNASVSSTGVPAGHDSLQPAIDVQTDGCTNRASRRTQDDTFELLRALVQGVLLERHGYVISCALVEPPSCEPEAIDSSLSRARSGARPPLPLSLTQTWDLLSQFEKFMAWQDADLINIEDLHTIASTFLSNTSDLSPSLIAETVTAHHLPVDSVALMFGALALGAVATGGPQHGRFYFDMSTELVKYFVGQSTLELCLTFYLQHFFALRVGTLNYTQCIIIQAIQYAHDLGLHHNTHGSRGLQLYLLIYMADQYCSLTHNTQPIIRTSKLRGQIFQPLSDSKPQLRTLIDLVTINGYIIEHSHRLQNASQSDVLELESEISSLCSRLIGPVPAQSSGGGFRTAYEPLARVHMLCCRLKLRAPGLSEQASWLPSLCICVHAAEGVLSTYFQLYRPVLVALIKQRIASDTCTEKSSMPVTSMLPTTWRQVKRIMMSALVIIFAYWHGEMMHEEASRYIAMARLLLEYPRRRWGEKLDEALKTLTDISSLSDFRLYDHTQMLLPGAHEKTLRPSRDGPIGMGRTTVTDGLNTDQTGTHDEAFHASTPWHSVFDAVSIDGPLESDINTFQSQTPFGFWEIIECPVEGLSQMSNQH